MMASHTVHVVTTSGAAMVDCETCGPLGVYQGNVDTVVYDHLDIVHGCNMEQAEIRDHKEVDE